MENTTLNLDRFNELAEAYGGEIARWPQAVRAAAFAFAEADRAATAPVLTEAARLDGWLNASPNPAPSPALRDAILAAAPRPRRAAMARRWAGVGLGAGLAAASVAGVLTGVAAAPIAAHIRQTADTVNDAARWLGEPTDVSEG